MRILEVSPAYYPSLGGVEEHVRNISEKLAEKYDVSVATSDFPGNLPKVEVINGVRIMRFKYWAPSGAYFFSRGLKDYLMKNSGDFDVVHAHSYHAFPALYAAQSKEKNKLVFTPHYIGGGSTIFRKILHVPYKYWASVIFERSDKIICTSNYERNMVLKKWKISDEKVVLIPNGVCLENFSVQKRAKNYKSILCVSRLEKYKGAQYVVRTMPYLSDDVILEIVGRGSFREGLANLAHKLGVGQRVKFYQDLSKDELLQKYADADLFVLLSERENFAICVAEALAARTPCIVANRMALREWVDDRNCFGIDFPINIEELGELIKRTLGKKIEGFRPLSWPEVAGRIAELYTSILKA